MKIRNLSLGLGAVLALGFICKVAADAKDETFKGEVIDTYCYATMGAKREGHRQCGLGCAKKGIPVALLQEKTNKVYILLPDKDATALPETVADKMGQEATITGHAYAK